MDLGEILRIMRDRWYVVVPMLMLAVGLGAAAVVVVPNSYESYSTVSLLSSPMSTSVATEGNDNPFLTFDASLVATADFLGRSLQSTDSVKELKRLGVTEKYTVALADGAQGPFLTFTVIGDDEAHVLQATGILTQFAAKRLMQIQQDNGVKTQDMIRMTEIIPPQAPKLKLKDKVEVVLAVSGGTTALALLLTFMLESVSRSRARKRDPEAAKTGGRRPITSQPVSPTVVVPQPRAALVGAISVERAADQTMVLPLPAKASYVEPAERRSGDADTEMFLLGPSGTVSTMGKTAANGKAPAAGSPTGTYRSSGVSDVKGQEDAGSANGR